MARRDASKLIPGDRRVHYSSANIRGKTYAYMVGEPPSEPTATIILLHGFPDIGFGWRCQVPALVAAGFRVVVPDMLGYGGTDAPHDLSEYTFKSLSADIEKIAAHFVGEKGQIILGGHDWGGALTWRVAMWYPELVMGVFSICTPYNRPTSKYTDLEQLVAAGKVPNFAYQLQLRGTEVEAAIQGQEKVRQFLNGMHGGVGPHRELAFDATKGVYLDRLSELSLSRLLSEAELSHYTQLYMKQPAPQLRGPLNWYRTRRLNYEEELQLVGRGERRFEMPALFVSATRDTALPPGMAEGMDRHFSDLTRGEVESSHWALSQAGDAVNEHVLRWLKRIVGGGVPKPAI